jgi:hypothetical protein
VQEIGPVPALKGRDRQGAVIAGEGPIDHRHTNLADCCGWTTGPFWLRPPLCVQKASWLVPAYVLNAICDRPSAINVDATFTVDVPSFAVDVPDLTVHVPHITVDIPVSGFDSGHGHSF